MVKKTKKKQEQPKTINKTRKTKKLFKSPNCSPSKEFGFSCYSSKSLNKIKQLWNKRHPDTRINTNDMRKIWEQLKDKMSNVCNSEKCWLNQTFLENNLDYNLKNHTFAPESPLSWKKNPNEWLNSMDINKIMKQYEKAYPTFAFIGPSPIDFDHKQKYGDCVWSELCNFSLEHHIKKGKRKIGIIFNTDPHYLDGSHWICKFIDINKEFIYYFDSNADKTPKQINNLAKRITEQGKSLGINFKYHKNKTEHQKANTECGMYVLYVITELLKHKISLNHFNKRIPDKEMEKLRKVFFNQT